ncbi:MAG: NRDE family protein, partial [Thermoguttaceae bacterium]|nr:NRDE family protein [Thermoguttaceae bacterium]
MGILAIQYRTVDDAPILIALNREEEYSRQFQPPRIQSGRPRVVCGLDRKSGGTWAGVNQHGMFVAALNAPKRAVPFDPRSRGLLC